jgi:hypothetical protein
MDFMVVVLNGYGCERGRCCVLCFQKNIYSPEHAFYLSELSSNTKSE